MNGRKPNKAEREWLDKIVQLGCIACIIDYGFYTPPHVHHIAGANNHMATIPLCPPHHKNPGKGYETRHGNQARFEARYGTDQELLTLVQEKVGYDPA